MPLLNVISCSVSNTDQIPDMRGSRSDVNKYSSMWRLQKTYLDAKCLKTDATNKK